MKTLRYVVIAFLIVLFTPIFISTYLLFQNNKNVAPPSSQDIAKSLERATIWCLENETNIIKIGNPILWWMVGESAKLTGDQRLLELLERYIENSPRIHLSPWYHFFNTDCDNKIDLVYFSELMYYQKFFFYTLTCDPELSQLETIIQQKQASFCRENHFLTASCITHQLMGFRFMQRRHCGDPEENYRMVRVLQDKILTQLTWDPRIVDIYIQRVLMLVDSGDNDRVKPIWIKNILDAQLNDGGWGQSQPLVSLGSSSRHLCFTSKILGFATIKSDFHATAQGLWLMSMLATEI